MQKKINELVTIHGDISKNIKYALYAFYAILFVIIWHLGVGITIRPFSEIFKSLGVLWFEKGLASDIGQSLILNATALFSSLVLTLVVGYIAAFPLLQPIAFIISKGRFLGLMGLNAMFIELFGLGFNMKVALLTFGISVFYITSLYSIVIEIPTSRFDYARSLGLSKAKVLWQVVIRGTADQMLESLRQNAAIGWMMITAVEGIVKSGGIGDRLYHSYKHFDRGEVLAIIFCIILIGILTDVVLKVIREIITPHIVADRKP